MVFRRPQAMPRGEPSTTSGRTWCTRSGSLEAMLIAPQCAIASEPFVVSTWGNDLTLWAAQSWAHRRLNPDRCSARLTAFTRIATEISVSRNNCGILGRPWSRPGSGGIDLEKLSGDGLVFEGPRSLRQRLEDAPIIFNPRSYRLYVRNDVFFASLPALMRRFPTAIAVTVGMDRNTYFQDYAAALGISERVRFLPAQDRSGMADRFAPPP